MSVRVSVRVHQPVRVCARRLCSQSLRKPADVCDRDRASTPGYGFAFGPESSVSVYAPVSEENVFPGPDWPESPHPDMEVGAQVCLCVSSTVISSSWDKRHQGPLARSMAPLPAAGEPFGGTPLGGHRLPGDLERRVVPPVSWAALIFRIASLPVIVPVLPASAVSRRPHEAGALGHFVSCCAWSSARHTVGAQQALGWLRSLGRLCCHLYQGVVYTGCHLNASHRVTSTLMRTQNIFVTLKVPSCPFPQLLAPLACLLILRCCPL